MSARDLEQLTKADPRWERQRAIEEAITKLAPDFNEALEIVCAIQAAVESRYDHRSFVAPASEAFNRLRQALNKADDGDASVGPFGPPPQVNDQYVSRGVRFRNEDDAYDTHRQRQIDGSAA